jgi:hypothetical protein
MIQRDITNRKENVMIKCKDCKQDTPFDYFSPDGATCLDCIDPDTLADLEQEMSWQQYEQAKDEGTLDLYRDVDCVIEDD